MAGGVTDLVGTVLLTAFPQIVGRLAARMKPGNRTIGETPVRLRGAVVSSPSRLSLTRAGDGRESRPKRLSESGTRAPSGGFHTGTLCGFDRRSPSVVYFRDGLCRALYRTPKHGGLMHAPVWPADVPPTSEGRSSSR